MDTAIETIAQGSVLGRMGRRGFFKQLLCLAGTTVAARSVLGANGIALPLFVPQEPSGADVVSAMVKYPGEGATLQGYLSRPRSAGPFSAVIVIDECRGFDENFCSAARSLASDGYVTLVVDLLSRQGGTASFAAASLEDDAAKTLANLRADDVLRDVEAARRYLRSHPAVLPDSIRVMGRGQAGSSRLRIRFPG